MARVAKIVCYIAAAAMLPAFAHAQVEQGILGIVLSKLLGARKVEGREEPIPQPSPSETFDKEAYERKLAEGLAKQQADLERAQENERRQYAAEKVERARAEADPNTYAQKIRDMKGRARYFQSVIDNERQIAEVSGVADRSKLYLAGQQLVMLRKQINEQYVRYRAKGGRKPLSSL